MPSARSFLLDWKVLNDAWSLKFVLHFLILSVGFLRAIYKPKTQRTFFRPQYEELYSYLKKFHLCWVGITI